jgi:biopolymer transport protein ExbD
LEIIPLIDVMFFLLASFMMVSLTMTKQKTIKVSLPAASSTSSDFKPESLHIGVNQQGDTFWESTAITLPDLTARLQETRRKAPDTPVHISGDADARHADMVRVLDAVRAAGFNKVAFNVKSATP